jgi:hypothetical protein
MRPTLTEKILLIFISVGLLSIIWFTTSPFGYNHKTDKIINIVAKSENIIESKKTDTKNYIIFKNENYKLKIIHYFQIPFESEEKYNIFLTEKSGKNITINFNSNVRTFKMKKSTEQNLINMLNENN